MITPHTRHLVRSVGFKFSEELSNMVHPTGSAALVAAAHIAELHRIPAAASAAALASNPFAAAAPASLVAAAAFQTTAAFPFVAAAAAGDNPQTWCTAEALSADASDLPFHHMGIVHCTLPNFHSDYYP